MLFPGALTDPPNATLILSLGAAFFYLLILRQPPSLARTAVKAGSVLLLAILAFIQGGPLLLVIALLLSAAGDALLAQNDEWSFSAGLGAFLAAHLTHVVLFLPLALHAIGLADGGQVAMRVALAAAVGAAAVVYCRRLAAGVPGELQVPVALYVAAILAAAAVAILTGVQMLIAGMLMFVLSDAILAGEKFLLAEDSPHRAWTGPAVWILYYLAQLTITLVFVL